MAIAQTAAVAAALALLPGLRPVPAPPRARATMAALEWRLFGVEVPAVSDGADATTDAAADYNKVVPSVSSSLHHAVAERLGFRRRAYPNAWRILTTLTRHRHTSRTHIRCFCNLVDNKTFSASRSNVPRLCTHNGRRLCETSPELEFRPGIVDFRHACVGTSSTHAVVAPPFFGAAALGQLSALLKRSVDCRLFIWS